jgi:type IV secretory pathway TrbD component
MRIGDCARHTAPKTAHTPDDNLRKTLNGRDLLAVARDNWQAIARHNWLFFKDDADFEASFQKLMAAVDTDLDYVRQHIRLLVQAREWEAHGRDDSYLLTGAEIRDAETFLAQSVNKQPRPTDLHAEYSVASQKAEVKRQEHDRKLQRQARNRLRLLIGLLAAAILVIVGVFAWFAGFSNDAAYGFATQHLSSLAEVATRNINGDDFAAWVREAARNPERITEDVRYWEQAEWLFQVKASDPGIREVYTYIPDDEPGAIRFVTSSLLLDENPPLDPPDFLESYAPPGRAQFIGLQETHVLPDVVADEYGIWFSGFSPIRNSRGQPVGAVGIDMRYDSYLRAPSLVLQVLQTLLVLTGAAVIIGLIVFGVIRIRRRRAGG